MLGLVILVASFGYYRSEARIGATAEETHFALCALKADIERRRDASLEYLAKHPGPEPIPGISRQDILSGIKNQESTLEALAPLDC